MWPNGPFKAKWYINLDWVNVGVGSTQEKGGRGGELGGMSGVWCVGCRLRRVTLLYSSLSTSVHGPFACNSSFGHLFELMLLVLELAWCELLCDPRFSAFKESCLLEKFGASLFSCIGHYSMVVIFVALERVHLIIDFGGVYGFDKLYQCGVKTIVFDIPSWGG